MSGQQIFGQYQNKGSFLNKTNPFVKLLLTLELITITFLFPLTDNIYLISGLVGFALFTLLILALAKVNIFKIIKSLTAILTLLILTVLIKVLTYWPATDEKAIFEATTFSFSWINLSLVVLFIALLGFVAKYIKINLVFLPLVLVFSFALFYFLPNYGFYSFKVALFKKPLFESLFLVIRVICVLFLMSGLTTTTSPLELTYALEKLFYPLKLIGIKIQTFTFVFSLTIRFIPSLGKQVYKITEAQKARGFDLKSANIFRKIKFIVAILIPLFVHSFKAAFELADALDVRGFDLDKPRTEAIDYRLKAVDWILIVFFSLLTISAIVLRILGLVYGIKL